MAKAGNKMVESDFRSWLGRQFERRKWFFQPIETTTKAGVPDVYCILAGKPTWLELKVGTSKFPLIRKEQRLWALKHHQRGGRTLLIYYRYDLGQVYVYMAPYENVTPSGRYLSLNDEPILIDHVDHFLEEPEKMQ